jgi:hypothetical protein
MKSYSGQVPFGGPQAMCRAGLQLALILTVALFAAGCGKKESPKPVVNAPPESQTATQAAAPNAAAPQTPLPAQANPTVASGVEADPGIIQRLNQAVMGFRLQKNRYPTSVEEVAAFANIQLPPPPAGKKYVLNGRGLIELVDNPAK